MKRETPNQKVERLLTTVPRLFAVKVGGIWTKAYGVYIKPLRDPFIVKIIHNGREMIFPDPQYYSDHEGYSEKNLDENIISRNLATLPKPPPGPKLIYSYRRPRMADYVPLYYTGNLNFTGVVDITPITPATPVPENAYVPPVTIHAEGPAPVVPPNTIIIDTVAGEDPAQPLTVEGAVAMI